MKKLLLAILLFSNAAFAQKGLKSGIVYNEHPYIETVKKIAALYEQGNADGMAKFYADTAHIYGMTRYDTSAMARHLVTMSKSVKDAQAGWQQVIDNWSDIKMVPISQIQAVKFADEPVTVQSRWLITMKNKKTNKTAAVEMVLFDQFNKDGKIATQKEYYDPTPLLA
ncbi:MAG: nuclear transport factor 2 family protein, partial [Mucilaginibacter sp.]